VFSLLTAIQQSAGFATFAQPGKRIGRDDKKMLAPGQANDDLKRICYCGLL
jgi:hypothetical protein